jgi:hypothetical protein
MVGGSVAIMVGGSVGLVKPVTVEKTIDNVLIVPTTNRTNNIILSFQRLASTLSTSTDVTSRVFWSLSFKTCSISSIAVRAIPLPYPGQARLARGGLLRTRWVERNQPPTILLGLEKQCNRHLCFPHSNDAGGNVTVRIVFEFFLVIFFVDSC